MGYRSNRQAAPLAGIRSMLAVGLVATFGMRTASAEERVTIVVGGMDVPRTFAATDRKSITDIKAGPFSNNSLQLANAFGGSKNGYHFVPWTGNLLSKKDHEKAIQVTQQFIENQLKAGKTVSVLAHSDGAAIAYNALNRISANPPDLPAQAQVDKFVTIGTLLSDITGARGDPAQVTAPAVLRGGWLNVASKTDQLSAAINRPGIIDVAISNPHENKRLSVEEHFQYYQDKEVRRAIQAVLEGDGDVADILVTEKLVSLSGNQRAFTVASDGSRRLIDRILRKDVAAPERSDAIRKRLHEEARREHHEDQRIEYRADRLRDLDRQAEYQFAKSAIDAHGNRVRIETYLRRPLPTQVEHWVLNYRAQRFDYGYFRRTYAQPLASLSDIPRLDALTGGSPTLPSNYLVQSEEVRSNTRDSMRFTTDFGAPAAVNDPVRGTIYVPITIDLRTRLVGPGYDALKSHFTTTNNPNDFRNISRYPDAGGNLAVWLDSTINRASSLCAPCTTNTAVAPEFQFSPASPNFVTVRHKDNTFLSYENWVLKDDGTPVPNGAVGNDINYEFRNRATEFQGRDIDIVYPSRFLVEGAPGAF